MNTSKLQKDKNNNLFEYKRTALEIVVFVLASVLVIYLLTNIYKVFFKTEKVTQIPNLIIQYSSSDSSRFKTSDSIKLNKFITENLAYKENSDKHDSINTTIDLLNLVILGGGGVVAIMTLLVTLKLREWDKQHEESIQNLTQTNEIKLEAEQIKKENIKIFEYLKTIKNKDVEIENNIERTRAFFIRYSRGLSKYYSHNYNEAIKEFMNIYNDERLPQNYLDDVCFHLGMCYYKLINFSIEEIDLTKRENLSNAMFYFEKAYEKYSKDNNKANAKAYAAICLAYFTNPNVVGFELTNSERLKSLNKARLYIKEVLEIVNKSYRIDRSEYKTFSAALYNVACAFAVLYRFNRDFKYENNMTFGDRALDLLKIIHKELGLIDKEYVTSDPDWGVFVDYYSDGKDREQIVAEIGDFFSKKNSRWVIAKLCMDLYDEGGDKFKERALDLIKRCIATRLITVEQILNSNTYDKLKRKGWKKEIISIVKQTIIKESIKLNDETNKRLILEDNKLNKN